MQSKHTCQRRRLAATPVVSIDACSCGTIQVHLGALTLRFTPEGLSEVARGINEALVEFETARARSDDPGRAGWAAARGQA